MTRGDRKMTQPSKEELFFTGIDGVPVENWEKGKEFLVTDDKAAIIFDSQAFLQPEFPSLKDKIFLFSSVESRMDVAGDLDMVIVFLNEGVPYYYNTGKTFDSAMKGVTSADIPMLIDLQMVEEAKQKLVGQHLWTKSNLWYDENNERIEGKKFAPVTIEDVLPGTMIFPLKLKIQSEKGEIAYMFMNYGNADNESRAFHNLFSITDIRDIYPNIEEDTWEYIGAGKIKLGMTKTECKLALGNPSDINSGHDYSQTLDIWAFDDGSVLWFEDGKLTKYRR